MNRLQKFIKRYGTSGWRLVIDKNCQLGDNKINNELKDKTQEILNALEEGLQEFAENNK